MKLILCVSFVINLLKLVFKKELLNFLVRIFMIYIWELLDYVNVVFLYLFVFRIYWIELFSSINKS